MKKLKRKPMGKTFWLTCSLWLWVGCDAANEDHSTPAADRLDSGRTTGSPSTSNAPADATTSFTDAGALADSAFAEPVQDAAILDMGPSPLDSGVRSDGGDVFDGRVADGSADGVADGDVFPGESSVPDVAVPDIHDARVVPGDGALAEAFDGALPRPDDDGDIADASDPQDASGLAPVNMDGGLAGPVDVGVIEPNIDADIAGYPDGPFGTDSGETIENLVFTSIDDQPYTLDDMRREENVHLIALLSTAAWCPACRRAMGPLSVYAAEERDQGLLVSVAMYHNANFEPARAVDAAEWQDMMLFQTMVADPAPVMAPYFTPFGRDKLILIDARTMTIVALLPRYSLDRLRAAVAGFRAENRE